TPPTSQLDWLSSTTAMIVLFWSRATRDLLKSFGWGIAALHRLDTATKLPFPRRPPHRISLGPTALSRCGRPRATSIRMSFREGPRVCRLSAGGSRIRTLGPPATVELLIALPLGCLRWIAVAERRSGLAS